MSKDIKLKKVRLSYAHLSVPSTFVQGEGYKEDPEAGVYSAVLVIPKGSESEKLLLEAVKEVKSEALAAGIKSSGNKLVKVTDKDVLRYNDGVKDGDTKEDDVYANAILITAKAKAAYKPAVYNKDNVRIENNVLYSGCYVNVYLRVYNYAAASNIGCSYALIAVQFEADGESLVASVDTDSIFGDKVVAKTSDMF